MKIAYLGYDLFYPCLERLLSDNNIEVLKIFSFPENEDDKHEKIKNLANKYNIDFTEDRITEDDIDNLVKKGTDLLVCAGYSYKIPINEKINGINLHPALLPEGRGAWPMPLTILKGLTKTGLTVHKITPNFDDGAILKQKEYTLKKDETLESLNSWLTDNCAALMHECVINFKELMKNAKLQTIGEYWKMPTKKEMSITKETNAFEADRITRAFYGSTCFYIDNGHEVNIKKAYVDFDSTIINSKNEFLLSDGKLVVEEIEK